MAMIDGCGNGKMAYPSVNKQGGVLTSIRLEEYGRGGIHIMGRAEYHISEQPHANGVRTLVGWPQVYPVKRREDRRRAYWDKRLA
jgi:hypothetical protein